MCPAPSSGVMFVTRPRAAEEREGSAASQTATDTRGSRRMLRIFWCVWTVLMTTCSPSVSTQVWVVCGEPSGINVLMKHGFRPRIHSTNRSGRSTSMTLVQGSDRPVGETRPMGRHKMTYCPAYPADRGDNPPIYSLGVDSAEKVASLERAYRLFNECRIDQLLAMMIHDARRPAGG